MESEAAGPLRQIINHSNKSISEYASLLLARVETVQGINNIL